MDLHSAHSHNTYSLNWKKNIERKQSKRKSSKRARSSSWQKDGISREALLYNKNTKAMSKYQKYLVKNPERPKRKKQTRNTMMSNFFDKKTFDKPAKLFKQNNRRKTNLAIEFTDCTSPWSWKTKASTTWKKAGNSTSNAKSYLDHAQRKFIFQPSTMKSWDSQCIWSDVAYMSKAQDYSRNNGGLLNMVSAQTYSALPSSAKMRGRSKQKNRHSYGQGFNLRSWQDSKEAPYQPGSRQLHSEYSNLASMDASHKNRRKAKNRSKNSSRSSGLKIKKKGVQAYVSGTSAYQANKNRVLINLKS